MTINTFKLLFTVISFLGTALLCELFDINSTTVMAAVAFIISMSLLAENLFIKLVVSLYGNDVKRAIKEVLGEQDGTIGKSDKEV
jgi:hypothetical protein